MENKNMAQIDNIEQSFTAINETLDRIEARIDEMNRMLDTMVEEIDRYKNGSSKNMTSTYDNSDESMYDINRSI